MTRRHSEALITAIPRSQSLAAPAPPASLEFSVMFPASQKKMCILISFYPPKPKIPSSTFGGLHILSDRSTAWFGMLWHSQQMLPSPQAGPGPIPLVAFGIGLLQRDSSGSFWGCGNAGFVLMKEIKGWELEKNLSPFTSHSSISQSQIPPLAGTG